MSQSSEKDKTHTAPEKEKRYAIVHNRPGCIGCGSCAAIAEEYWEMDNDGLSNLKGALRKEGKEIKLFCQGKEKNKDAADVCPVDVIHVVEITDEDTEETVFQRAKKEGLLDDA